MSREPDCKRKSFLIAQIMQANKHAVEVHNKDALKQYKDSTPLKQDRGVLFFRLAFMPEEALEELFAKLIP